MGAERGPVRVPACPTEGAQGPTSTVCVRASGKRVFQGNDVVVSRLRACLSGLQWAHSHLVQQHYEQLRLFIIFKLFGVKCLQEPRQDDAMDSGTHTTPLSHSR